MHIHELNQSIMRKPFSFLLSTIVVLLQALSVKGQLPSPVTLTNGWQLQDMARVPASGQVISTQSYSPQGWYKATVPGTVLTTLVNNKVYPEPLYGENNRPNKIPESVNKTSYWYRTEFAVPASYAGRHVWLNFDGINYTAQVWVNGKQVGMVKGAFARGIFDVTAMVSAGKKATLAVLVSPQPNPGVPHEHTIGKGMGANGGISALDGPTFLCSMGWDWIPAIRDRNTGIWQNVTLSARGPVIIKDPLVTSDLKLPGKKTADITINTTVENITDKTVEGVLKGSFGAIKFQKMVSIAPNSKTLVSFDAKNTPQLRITKPQLWWPNGYGPQNLYKVALQFDAKNQASDRHELSFGIRKITYKVPESENLTVSVNGVPIFCKGGNWGMDEAMKRIPRPRLEAQIRMHKQANYNIIRNLVGQSTSKDLYELCDKYGIMLWDEFFQPNPGDGPNPADIDLYIANVREKILRFRNHSSIAIWCARNEGYPPKEIDDKLRELMAELEPTRLYQPSSTAGRGVNSGGPYSWRVPTAYYEFDEAYKTEIGSMSIPTLESVQGMLEKKDWEIINDAWAEHDFANGAQNAISYRKTIDERYGKVLNLADFVRKGQLANYEAFRAMYEGRNAQLFAPSTGVITWMSNPAQPSFVWQLYHHDLETNASLFATKKACEPVHIQLNEKENTIQVINNLAASMQGRAEVEVYDMNGKIQYKQQYIVEALPSKATNFGKLLQNAIASQLNFIKLKLWNKQGQLVSDNFYWKGSPEKPDELQALEKLQNVKLDVTAMPVNSSKNTIKVTLHNPGRTVALMAHIQLRRAKSNLRVLPAFYSDNYVSLLPNETRVLTVEFEKSQLNGEKPLITIDGWNVEIGKAKGTNVSVKLNANTQVNNWPVSGLPIHHGPGLSLTKINCGGDQIMDFAEDNYYSGGAVRVVNNDIDCTAPMTGPKEMYQNERFANTIIYTIPVKALPTGKSYTVNMHWAETIFSAPGKRKFNVVINNKDVLADFDVVQEAGKSNKAIVKQFNQVSPNKDGTIEVKLTKGSTGYPMISGIEIVESSTH